MKKFTSIALAAVMATSMATAAFALEDGKVNPGTSFKFGADKFVVAGNTTALSLDTDAKYMTDDYFAISKVEYTKGRELIESVKFDGEGTVEVKTKANYKLESPSIDNVVIKNITLTAKKDTGITVDTVEVKKNTKLELGKKDVSVAVGYAVEEIEISSEFTADVNSDVITKFTGSDYGLATMDFFGGDISVDVRVYKNEKYNFTNDNKANLDVVKANPDAELTFYNFSAAPEFSSNATISISADEDSFIYEIKDGKLVKTSFKWDKDAYSFVGKSRTLGSYVVSDVELKAIAASEVEDGKDDAKNPNTGANDVVGVAVALAAISLVAAGAVSIKK